MFKVITQRVAGQVLLQLLSTLQGQWEIWSKGHSWGVSQGFNSKVWKKSAPSGGGHGTWLLDTCNRDKGHCELVL